MHNIQKNRRKKKTRRNIRKTKKGNKGTKGNIERNIIDNTRNARTIKGIIMKTQNKLWIYGKGQKEQ